MSALETKGTNMTFLWIVLGVLYVTLFVMLGIATLRKGHYLLFIVGFVFPLLWIVGAMMAPTSAAAAAEARTSLG